MNPIVEQNIKTKIRDFAEQLSNYPEVIYNILLQLYLQEELNFDEDGRAYNRVGEYFIEECFIDNDLNDDVNKESELEL